MELQDLFKAKWFKNRNLGFWVGSAIDVYEMRFKNALVITAQSMCKKKFNIGKKWKLYNHYDYFFNVHSHTAITGAGTK